MKGGTQPIIILMVSLVVVPGLCVASSAAALLPALASENVVDAAAALKVKAEYIIKVNFSTSSATPDKYKSFIASVRAGLVSTAEANNGSGIPVLVSEDDPLALEASLNVTLVNKAGRSVSLKMDVSRAYFVGYEAGDFSCLLKRSGSGRTLSSVTCYRNLYPWGGPPTVTVDDDPAAVAAWRAEDLDQAISSLFLFPTGNATKEDLSRGLAACDVMIASAATFPYVERRMSAGMWDGNGVSNDGSLRGLQESWPELSAAVQESYQGAFAAPVGVERSNGEWMQVDNVRRAVPLVSFLENAGCKKTTTREAVGQRLPLLIRSVVQEPYEDDMQLGGAAACGQAEPTVRLVGPEGRCVDVPYGYYYNGKQVQLWSCKSNGDVNQLWTLKRDGTIRSNGKCLASSGDAAGARVVIDDCPRVPTGRVVWEMRVDGTVALKRSRSLVLAVTSSTLFAGLTVRRDDRGTGQSWTPTNDTAPLDAAIVGFRDLCLQADYAGAVSVAACSGNGVQWSLYPDGSIRPPAWLLLQWQCLAADGASGRVRVKYCDWAGSACERWVFRNDGTIFNTGTGMVLDVVRPSKSKGATASSGQVVVSKPATGSPTPTQKWALIL
ncbi:ricin-like [Miscanthus floridulus]|uniref:ricin-like n=1 Tax=Miscanthus floridulus TaxID=154761 RepID=UPI003459323B